jgi:acetyl esterase
MVSIDAAAFDPASVAPELAGANEMLVGGLQAMGWSFPPESAPALRDAMAAGAAVEPYLSPRAEDREADGVPVRVVPAAGTPSGVFVHCHGGGWTIGSALGQDATLERISDRTGMTVVSVDYRLAPEHPYPAGLDDCERATRWVVANASSAFGADKVLLGGESAGANLALCAALRVVADAPEALAALALYYGNYDLTGTPSQRAGVDGVMITTTAMDWFYDQYVADPSRRAEPDISPLYADLGGLPPTALAAGTADSLVDDTLFLAARLTAARVPTELVLVPGGEHAFDMLPLPVTQEAVARVDDFLARHAKG